MAKGYRQSSQPKHLKQVTGSKEDTLIDIGQVKHQAEDYFEKHKMPILGIFGALVLVVGGYLGYRFLYEELRNKEALEQMYQAEFMFEKDSFDMALNNPGGGFPGFKEIADTYGGTVSGNLAKYYAGICNLYLKNYEEAKNYFESFSGKGEIMPILKYGGLADALSELNQKEEAVKAYEKAVTIRENSFLTPFYLKRLGVLRESLGDKEGALKAYKEIESKYPNSPDGMGIEKFILPIE